MAVSNVELIVNAVKAINPLRKVEQQSKKVDQALKKSQKSARDVEAAFQRMGRNGIRSLRDLEGNAAKLGKRMGGLRANVAKAVIAFGAFKSAQVAIQRIESERRIKFLAQSYGEVAELQDAATKAAERFGTGQTEANRALADVFARLRPVGVGLKDIVSVYNGFNTAAKISGSTAVEASNAFRQLSQALGSGALRGDEFNSISEQVPGILTAISKETGVAQGQLRKFASEGGITADIVIRALKRIETEGAAQLEDALGGPAQAIVDFQNATEDVQVALTEAVIPELSKSFVILAEIINDLKPVIQAVGSFAAKVLGGIADTIKRIRDPGKLAAEQQAFFAEGRMRGRMRRGERGLANLPVDYAAQEAALFEAAAPDSPKLPTLPTLPPLKDKGTGSAEAIKEQAEATGQLNLDAISYLETLEETEKIQFEAGRQIAEQLNLQDRLTKEAERRAEAERLAAEAADPGNKMRKDLEELLKLENQVAAGATAIGNSFSNAFTSIIQGTKSADQAIADMLSSVAEHFMDMAAQIIAKQLAVIAYGLIMKALGVSMPGGGGSGAQMSNTQYFNPTTGLGVAGPNFGLSEGAFVPRPTRAVVGEGSEPEYVIPESKMRESMARYAQGNRGAAVIPGGRNAEMSSEGGGTAVTAPIDVRYTVERINSVDYVTADQFQQGMQQAANQGAKQGEQQTLKRLQMSSSTRKRLGM